ncbi:MAG: sigma 54-interacting transcriptional regulator [Candidatus Sumerlaeaceae bacterium]
MAKFIIKQGSQPGTEIAMQGPQLVFGRTEECDVMIADANVSRRHAQAVMLNGLVAIVDLNSSNGTLVNGLPISRIFLMDGDEVQLGSTTLVYSDERDGRDVTGAGAVKYLRPEAPELPSSEGPGASAGAADQLTHTQLFSPLSEDVQADALKEVYLKLKSLYRVFAEVAQAASLKEMFEAVGRAATLSTGVERVIFFLPADKSGSSYQKYFMHTATRLDPKAAAASECQQLLDRARADQRLAMGLLDEKGRCSFGESKANALALPLIRGGKLAAILYTDNPGDQEPISKNDVDFLTTLGLQLSIRLNQFEQVQQLAQENVQLRRSLDEDFAVIVQNEKMKQIMAVAARVAESDSTVLITGESGTGKEMIAKTIHKFSRRGGKPWVAVNCAALPETLLESELFGHEKGAFTGAMERRVGKFELADGGTLFLDEIGDISASAQAKLLRVLQEGELQRVGGNKVIKVDVRLVTATNKTLIDEVKAKRFREDLFFRLKVIEISLPPLRQRPDDIPALAEYFFKQLRQRVNTSAKTIAPETMQVLSRYPFPGNVRELRNVIERGLVFAFGDALLPEHLPIEVTQGQSGLVNAVAAEPGLTYGSAPDQAPLSLEEMEKHHIQHVLKFVKGNKLKAAQLLGISRTTLYEKLKQYELATLDEGAA